MKKKFEYGDIVRITEEAAEMICSREPDIDFDFKRTGKIVDMYKLGKHQMYEVEFKDRKMTIPQSYLEKIEKV